MAKLLSEWKPRVAVAQRPAQLVLCRIAVPTTLAQIVNNNRKYRFFSTRYSRLSVWEKQKISKASDALRSRRLYLHKDYRSGWYTPVNKDILSYFISIEHENNVHEIYEIDEHISILIQKEQTL